MPIHAISRYYQNISDSIVTDLSVVNPFNGLIEKTSGIWDTGATNSCISKNLAQKLGFQTVQRTTVIGVHGPQEVNVYFATIILPNENIKINIPVTECNELSKDGSISVLIGMDVITKGDFCITNLNGKTVMTFRSPSIELIDWVDDINKENKIHKMHKIWSSHGNDKCPCGSGRLYKNCHGKKQ
jgi:hypothetical protein